MKQAQQDIPHPKITIVISSILIGKLTPEQIEKESEHRMRAVALKQYFSP